MDSILNILVNTKVNEKKDIFDRVMLLPGLRLFNPFYKKNKEVLLYLFFGVLTFFVGIFTYAYFNVTLEMNELIANIISWVIAVTFAFVTNRIWVFQASTKTLVEFIKQMASFFVGRVMTLIIEEIILLVFISILGFDSMIVKIVAQIVVIVFNYAISKLVVFRKNNGETNS